MKQTQCAPLWFLFALLLASVSATPAFNLYFIPAEVMADASLLRVGPQGSIANNYLDFFSESGVAYLQKPIYVAGQVTQDSVPTVSVSLATTTITFVDTSVSPLLAYASLFPDVPPTSESSFSILAQDLNVLKANPFNNATSLLINVPDYSSTLERTLVFDLPYKLNVAFFVVRVTPMTQAFVQMNFDSDDFCFARVALGGPVKYTNYAPSRLSGTSRAIFEWSIPFGQSITDVAVGFPEDTYNVTLSNWADIASFPFPNVRPFAAGTAPASLTAFSWPPSSLISSLFTYLPSSLQFGRNPAAKLFHVQDYVLIAHV